MNATSAEDCFEKKSNAIVFSISRDPEHIRHTTFVQINAVRDTEPVPHPACLQAKRKGR